MRILAFDHFFNQDLDALRAGLEPSDHLEVVPYQRLYYLARRRFPLAAFAGVRSAYSPKYERHWARYKQTANRFADWMIAAHQPDVFVVPSDAFFYLRPVIQRFDEVGLPTVVMQKETTISPMVMEDHSRDVRVFVPFTSAAMTVCSERHRQFWIAAGSDPDQVIVTGQPRFDLYAEGRAEAGIPDHPTILYLSYADDAYLPSDLGHAFAGSWRELRRETELTLAAVADRGDAHIVAKPHPQQLAQPDWLGQNVERANPLDDTRQLITRSDLVVGFQTTALFEAAASGRPVVYAAWGDVLAQVRDTLIPFDRIPDLVHTADSQDELAALLSPPWALQPAGPAGLAEVARHLGPIDGHATERVIGILRVHASQPLPVPLPWTTVARVAANQLSRPLVALMTIASPVLYRPAVRNVLTGRRSALAQEWTELRRVLARSSQPA